MTMIRDEKRAADVSSPSKTISWANGKAEELGKLLSPRPQGAAVASSKEQIGEIA